jgi:hypothetical protein
MTHAIASGIDHIVLTARALPLAYPPMRHSLGHAALGHRTESKPPNLQRSFR